MMRHTLRAGLLVSLAFGLALAVMPEAQAQEAANKPTGFAAPTAAEVDPADPTSLLAECDRRLEACKRDSVGGPYLAAAYMAIWVLLLGFLFSVRRGQARMAGEIAELEARLESLGGGSA